MTFSSSSVSSMLFGALLLVGGAVACDGLSGDDDAPFESDCKQICEKYEGCVDGNTDIDNCTADCVENSLDSSNFQEQVDECETCLDGEGCAAAVFGCSDDCAEVIDEST